MTLGWYLAHPAETVLLMLAVIGAATYLEYRISILLGWPFSLPWTVAGCLLGLIPALAALAVVGVEAVILATVAALALVTVMIRAGGDRPDTLDVDNHLRGDAQ